MNPPPDAIEPSAATRERPVADSLSLNLDAVKRRLKDCPDKLEILYVQQMEWARHFNNLIWAIAGVLIPVSLAGFALSFRGDDGQIDKATLVATSLASSALLLFWLFLAEWHRRLWRTAFTLTGLIEEVWGYRDSSKRPKQSEKHLLGFLRPIDLGPYIRRGFVALVWLGWGFRVAWAETWPPQGLLWWVASGLAGAFLVMLIWMGVQFVFPRWKVRREDQ